LARDYLPSWLDAEKVFLLEYGFTAGTVKGGAHDEILRQLDRGAVFWHYIGHGNPYKLADEDAFTITDVPAMANGPRLPVFLAAGCEVGPFDNPYITPLGEALVKHPGGGTIASFASPVLTYSYQNYDLGKAMYGAMFSPPELGGAKTLGEAAFVAKHRASVSMNDITYHLLGDPGLAIAVPRADVRIQLRDEETGVALDDSLVGGRRIQLEAEIHGSRDPASSEALNSFEGTAVVRVTDAPKLNPFPLFPGEPFSPIQDYEANPRTAYQGEFPVRDGRLVADFVLPVEARPGVRARVDVYATNGALDASGSNFVQVAPANIGASDSTAKGPKIQVRSKSGGTLVGPNEGLIVTLEDPNGIFTLADSTGLGIQVAVDQDPATEVTDRFSYDTGSFTHGTLSYSLPRLSDGIHNITVSASNNLAREASPDAYRSHVTVSFQVAKLVDTTAVTAFVLPNPFRGHSGTHLLFSGFPEPTAAEVLVYDLSGRLVRHLSASGTGHVQVDWDGKDRGGRSLGSGIYLYRALLRGQAGGAEQRLDGRLVLLR
jgi:hypothetical protein